jgi:hypothetical protein
MIKAGTRMASLYHRFRREALENNRLFTAVFTWIGRQINKEGIPPQVREIKKHKSSSLFCVFDLAAWMNLFLFI